MRNIEGKGPAAGLTIAEASRIAGISRSTLYEELASGRLSARKCGRRTIIPAHALEEWMHSLPVFGSSANSEPRQTRHER
jgi:excisionase family DNA binding protein